MIIIEVKKKGKIDQALKRFKKKFEKVGTLKQIRRRMHYEKPSITRRQQILKAIYKQQLQQVQEND